MPQASSEALIAARRLLESGAPRLALDRVGTMKVVESDPTWPAWESVRCAAMRALKLDAELTALVNSHRTLHPGCLQAGAIAAIAQGEQAMARRFLARVVWQSKPDAESIRNARFSVIDSYVAQGNRDDAYRSMLRLQQDIGKPDAVIAERFVSTLLRLGMEKDAINWMAALEEGPTKLLLRLRAGIAAPDAVMAEARAAGGKSGDSRYALVLAEAGSRGGDHRVTAEGYERLLNAADEQDSGHVSALWQAYLLSLIHI